MKSQTLPAIVIDRLYAAAERLEARWIGAELRDDFGSERIEDALELLQKEGIDPAWTEAELIRRAVGKLHYTWKVCARRDAWRHADQRRRGTRPSFAPLDLPLVQNHHSVATDLYGGHDPGFRGTITIRECAQLLMEAGCSREDAWTYLWRTAWDLSWDDIVFLLEERFGLTRSSGQLRTHASRTFPAMRLCLYRALFEEDIQKDFAQSDTKRGRRGIQSTSRKEGRPRKAERRGKGGMKPMNS